MKKNEKYDLWTYHKLLKKIVPFGFLLMSFVWQSSMVREVQLKKVSLSDRNISFVELLKKLEKQTSCQFVYQNEQVEDLNVKQVRYQLASVEQILTDVLQETNLTYRVVGENIVIMPSERRSERVVEKPTAQQKKTIKGTVYDAKTQERLIGVNLIVKGSTTGVITDIDGNFKLDFTGDGKLLVVSYIGYETQEVPIVLGKDMQIKLKLEAEALDEVVVVGYGTQKKESVVGSVQTVNPGELKTSSANLSTGFAGRLAGVIAMQTSGEPGADGANFWIRGISTFSGATSPLIVIDGVQASQSDLNAIDPEVIESFSILKDATATALYGSRGANGVMIINTKTGRDLEKSIINLRLESSYSTPVQIPSFVDGVQYMEMFNEAVTSRKTGEILYPESKIAGTAQQLDPYVFPNVNWYDELFKKGTYNQNVNFNIRGGGQRLDYFSSVSLNRETGMLKGGEDFSYDNNINVMRYVFQNNINAYVTKSTKLSLRLNVQLRDYQGPHTESRDIFDMAMQANPVDFPVRFPSNSEFNYIMWGGKSGGAYNNGYRNPYAEMVRGYKDDFQSTVMANLRLNQKLDFITEGLSANALFSFKNWTQTETRRVAAYNQYEVKNYTLGETGGVDDFELQRVGEEKSVVLTTSPTNSGDRRIYLQAMIDYNRTFGGLHNISGMILYNQDEYSINNPSDLIGSLPQRKQGLAGRLTYSYDYRYLVEMNFGYNGSENFAEGNRFGFFPSVALGYTISREAWFSGLSETISNLKLRGSWGLVGNDQIGNARYLYLSDIDLTSGDLSYTTGRDQHVSNSGPKYNRYANPNITWEVGEKWNLGLDIGLWNSLNLAVDVFKETRRDIFMERTNIPDFIGTNGKDKWMDLTTEIYGNLGVVENKGLDFSLNYAKNFGTDWMVSFKGTFTYASNKILEYDEPDYQKYPNLSKVGQPVNRELLYVADRLFVDDAEVSNSAQQKIGGFVQAGDIKYQDVADVNGNYDGVIDANDREHQGHPTIPEILYGFGPSVRYKSFDFSLFFQGVARTSILMRDFHPFGTDGTRNVQQFIADDYWSENNQNIYAAYPRLSKQDNANNTAHSSYWLRNGSFLKLKNAEIGYNHKSFRLYLRGTNLFTFSEFDLWDPELGSGNGLVYPLQRVFNVGLQFVFNK